MNLLSEKRLYVRVYRNGDKVTKKQPKYLCDNEYYFLMMLQDSGYVPKVIQRLDDETVVMEYIERTPITDRDEWMRHLEPVLSALDNANIAHGDLTKYAVLARNNKPVIIDFAESRIKNPAPIPSKRREGDRYWLTKTMKEMADAAKTQ